VADLTDSDMRDLAAYYAYLPRVTSSGSAAGEPPRIVAGGAPLRGIAPCGACHGEVDSKASAAWLEGQPTVYLHTQLEAFSTGARHNDIGEQMRNVAQATRTVDSLKVAVLAALNIADELFSARARQQEIDGPLRKRVEKCVALVEKALEHSN